FSVTAKSGPVWLVGDAGPVWMNGVDGAVTSTTHCARPLVALPTTSMALTVTVCVPSASGPAIDQGLVQVTAGSESSPQVYDATSDALSVNRIDAEVELVGLAAPVTTGTAGAV